MKSELLREKLIREFRRDTMPKWVKEIGPESDIAISSRIRMARNIESMPFPNDLNEAQSKNILEMVHHTITNANSSFKKEFELIEMNRQDKIERLNYIEKHLISPALAQNTTGGAALINKEETISIMVNEEDHIRIQCLLPGLQLTECLDLGNKIDDLLEESIRYSFDEKLGYLTSCPTNVGTGVRASVMLHLPALSLTGYINGVFNVASKIGLAVRGIYGEGSQYTGNIYQISNQITLGPPEEELVSTLHDVTMQIIQNERAVREHLLASKNIELSDRVFRAYGILKSARLLTSTEAMQLISDLRLGVNLNLIQDVSIEKINELMVTIQPGYLQKYFNSDLSGIERDIKRAQLVRETL